MRTAEPLLTLLLERGLTVATAESLTGGLLCSELVAIPGASGVVLGGVVSYATRVKVDVLGVPAELVAEHGVVSEQCALAMARGVREVLQADVGIATTGVAGPDTQDGRPVGTVFVAVSTPTGTVTREVALSGDRARIRSAAVEVALEVARTQLSAK